MLSHYDLGTIESVTPFDRGSRQSPKVGIVAQRGKFLLKRRAAEKADLDRVRFAHKIQTHLARHGFPVAGLISTRDSSQAVTQFFDNVYELFAFIPGQPYRRSREETLDAGSVLARFHQLTEAVAEPHGPHVPRGDYHDAPGVRTGLLAIGAKLSAHDSFSGDEAELASIVQFLLERYDLAAEAVDAVGFGNWPERLVHADWHPGNLLFRGQKVAAVVDYDSIRWARGMIDVANGALQFTMVASGDPTTWPAEADDERYRAFLGGYRARRSLSADECAALPHLMAEALVAECVPPITRTGSVGRFSGFRILQWVRRKLTWFAEHEQALIQAAREAG